MILAVESILTNFVLPYIVNNLPTIKELLANNNTLESKFNASYKKALNNWCKNSAIREKFGSKHPSLSSLQDYLNGEVNPKDTELNSLLESWAEELRNDTDCYNAILECKIDKLSEKADSQHNEVMATLALQNEGSVEIISMLKDIQGTIKGKDNPKIISFINDTISGTVKPLIEQLRVSSALSVLQALESILPASASENSATAALIYFQKGQASRFTNLAAANEFFHKAFIIDPDNTDYAVEEAKILFTTGKVTEAKHICADLSEKSILSVAIEMVSDSDAVPRILEHVKHVDDKASFLQSAVELLVNKDCENLGELFVLDYIESPATLTYSNINAWLYSLGYYNGKLGGYIPLSRENADYSQQYGPAACLSSKFVNLLSRTDIKDSFPVIRLLNCYWEYLVSGDTDWIEEYQSISKDKLGEQKRLFILREASLLQMCGRTSEAFSLIDGLKNVPDELLVSFAVLLGFHAYDVEYIKWGLGIAIEGKIILHETTYSSICVAINKDTADIIERRIEEVEFDNEIAKCVVKELCNFFKGCPICTESFRDKCGELPDQILPFAAMLLSESGSNQVAFDILRTKVDEGKPNFELMVFLSVLSKNPEHHPHLYKILKENRKSGYDENDQLLLDEYQLAFKLADYEDAYEAISIVYSRRPDEETIFLNYLVATSKSHRELLEPLKQKVIDFHYSSAKAVHFVYSVFIQIGDIEFAADLLYRKAISMEDEDLKGLFFSESAAGSIKEIVCKEIDTVEAGLCVLFSEPGRNSAIIVKERTPLGRILIGKHKDDSFSINKEEHTILGIYPHYYKLHADYLSEVTQSGGNEHMRMFHFNPEGNILEEFERIINEIDPENQQYHTKRRKLISQYENGLIPLSSLTDSSQIIASYYKLLFGTFKVYVIPKSNFLTAKPFLCREEQRYVIDLPGLITLFEFSQKSGYKPSRKFLISQFLRDYIQTKQEYFRHNFATDFYEGLSYNNLYRFSFDYGEDVNLRMIALSDWVDNYCEAILDENALKIQCAGDDENSMLFAHTMSLILNTNNVLVSDEWFYLKATGGKVKQISTEFFITEIEGVTDGYSDFLLSSNIIGATVSAEKIVEELQKMRKGDNNVYQNILLTVGKNPDMFIPSINAGLIVSRNALEAESMRLTLTNLFTMAFETRLAEYFQCGEWKDIIDFLSKPSYNRAIVRDCLLTAKRIKFPLLIN